MKERPILFSASMVRAILSGQKTQTRRILKQATGPSLSVGVVGDAEGVAELSWLSGNGPGYDVHETIKRVPCPYGKPGDRLWVRESFSGSIAYERHGYPLREWGNKLWYWADGNPRSGDWTKPKPSIHMPRTLSRITLEITGVRVERLQDISDADAQAEGSPCYVCDRVIDGRREDDCHCFHRRATASDYRRLWEQIHGEGSWEANPWVWVVAFRSFEPGPC